MLAPQNRSEPRFAASKLRAPRAEFGLSAMKLAVAIGRHEWSIYSWERDETAPSIQSLVLLARFFGCGLEEFIEDSTTENDPAGGPGRSKTASGETRRGRA